MKKFVFVLAIAALFLLVNYLFSDKVRFEDIKSIIIGNTEIQVEVADDLSEQVQGLSGRDSLCETCGMVFIYEKPRTMRFWMKDMKFPLDIIFIRNGKVVEIFKNMPVPEPGKDIPAVQSREAADMVLEVNAGFAKGNKISEGARIDLEYRN